MIDNKEGFVFEYGNKYIAISYISKMLINFLYDLIYLILSYLLIFI